MEIKVKKGDIVWSYLGSFFQYCTSLIILPLILRNISTGELGLWYSFASIGTLVTYLDFGFSTTLVRNITYAWSGATKIQKVGFDPQNIENKTNIGFVKKVMFTCRVVCLLVAILAMIMLLSVGTLYVKYVVRNFENQSTSMIAWTIYAFAVFFNIYYNYCGNALRGIGLIGKYQKIIVCARVFQIIISFAGIKLGYGLIALSCAYLASGFIIRIGCYFALNKEISKEEKRQETLTEQKDNIQSRLKEAYILFKEVWYNAKKTGIIALCSYATNQSLVLICSAYLGVEETAPYGLCLQIITAIMSVAGIMFSAHHPQMINSMVLGREKEYRKTWSLSMFVFWIVAIGGIIAVIFLMIPLLTLMRSNTQVPVGMFAFMGLYMLLEHNHGEYTAYFTMRNDICYLRAYVISSVAIVLLSWIVAILGGSIYILMLVHFVIQICYNNWKWPDLANKQMDTTVLMTIREGGAELFALTKRLIAK